MRYKKSKPKNWVTYLKGAGKGIWRKLGGGEKLIEKLRKEWHQKEKNFDYKY